MAVPTFVDQANAFVDDVPLRIARTAAFVAT